MRSALLTMTALLAACPDAGSFGAPCTTNADCGALVCTRGLCVDVGDGEGEGNVGEGEGAEGEGAEGEGAEGEGEGEGGAAAAPRAVSDVVVVERVAGDTRVVTTTFVVEPGPPLTGPVSFAIDDASPQGLIVAPHPDGSVEVQVDPSAPLGFTCLAFHALTAVDGPGAPAQLCIDVVDTSSVQATWTGAASSDFSNTANWAGGFAPLPSSVVFIPNGTPHAPDVLGVAFVLHGLIVETGATLNLGAQQLTMAMQFDPSAATVIGGDVTGSNAAAIIASQGVIAGRFPGLRADAETLVGPVRALQLSLVNSFNNAAQDVTVDGPFTSVGGGAFVASGGRIVVNGDADFGGVGNTFAGGELVLRKSAVDGQLHGDGLHTTIFDGGATVHTVDLLVDDGALAFLGALEAQSGAVLTGVTVDVASNLTLDAGAVLDATGDLEIPQGGVLAGGGEVALEGVAKAFGEYNVANTKLDRDGITWPPFNLGGVEVDGDVSLAGDATATDVVVAQGTLELLGHALTARSLSVAATLTTNDNAQSHIEVDGDVTLASNAFFTSCPAGKLLFSGSGATTATLTLDGQVAQWCSGTFVFEAGAQTAIALGPTAEPLCAGGNTDPLDHCRIASLLVDNGTNLNVRGPIYVQGTLEIGGDITIDPSVSGNFIIADQVVIDASSTSIANVVPDPGAGARPGGAGVILYRVGCNDLRSAATRCIP